jgi:hypothetical protein
MRTGASEFGRHVAAALLCAVAAAPAVGNEIAATPQKPSHLTPQISPPTGDADWVQIPQLDPQDSALLDAALQLDPTQFGGPAKPLHIPGPIDAKPAALDMARTDRPDGTSTVIVKKPLTPAWTEWDAKVGADLGLATDTPNAFSPRNPLRVTRSGSGSGAAWASLGVPQLATVNARVDASNELGRLGTTLTRSLALGATFAVTLQSSYSVTETFGQPRVSPSDVPLMTLPNATAAAAEPVPHVWGNSNVAKFDILSTGTTLAAGLSSTSTDPVTHNTLSAEQKIYGPLRVTTAVTDVGQAGESKSIGARFKLNW